MSCLMASSSNVDLAENFRNVLVQKEYLARGLKKPEFRRDQTGHIFLVGLTPNEADYSELHRAYSYSNTFWDTIQSPYRVPKYAGPLKMMGLCKKKTDRSHPREVAVGWTPDAVAVDVTDLLYLDPHVQTALGSTSELPLLSDYHPF